MFIICLRLVGVGRPLPVSSMRMLFRIFWWGFVLNAITGSLLFAAHATITGNQPIYYAKLSLIAVGVVLAFPLQKFVKGDGSDGTIPSQRQGIAAVGACGLGRRHHDRPLHSLSSIVGQRPSP